MKEKKEVVLSRKLLIVIGIVTTILIASILGIGVLILKNSQQAVPLASGTKPMVDSSVVSANDSIGDVLKRREEAQKKVDEGMIGVQMTTTPTFPDGESMGQVLIFNPARNTKDFTVHFVTNETGEEVYRSGLIPVNKGIEEAKLTKSLSKGEYPAVAYFTTYNEQGEEDGKVGVDITIMVLN